MADHRRRDLCRNEVELGPVIGLADRGFADHAAYVDRETRRRESKLDAVFPGLDFLRIHAGHFCEIGERFEVAVLIA
jgi:hypothetical protein